MLAPPIGGLPYGGMPAGGSMPPGGSGMLPGGGIGGMHAPGGIGGIPSGGGIGGMHAPGGMPPAGSLAPGSQRVGLSATGPHGHHPYHLNMPPTNQATLLGANGGARLLPGGPPGGMGSFPSCLQQALGGGGRMPPQPPPPDVRPSPAVPDASAAVAEPSTTGQAPLAGGFAAHRPPGGGRPLASRPIIHQWRPPRDAERAGGQPVGGRRSHIRCGGAIPIGVAWPLHAE